MLTSESDGSLLRNLQTREYTRSQAVEKNGDVRRTLWLSACGGSGLARRSAFQSGRSCAQWRARCTTCT